MPYDLNDFYVVLRENLKVIKSLLLLIMLDFTKPNGLLNGGKEWIGFALNFCPHIRLILIQLNGYGNGSSRNIRTINAGHLN